MPSHDGPVVRRRVGGYEHRKCSIGSYLQCCTFRKPCYFVGGGCAIACERKLTRLVAVPAHPYVIAPDPQEPQDEGT